MKRYILSLLLVGLSTLTALGQKVMPLENNDGSVLPKELPRKGTLYLKDTHRPYLSMRGAGRETTRATNSTSK